MTMKTWGVSCEAASAQSESRMRIFDLGCYLFWNALQSTHPHRKPFSSRPLFRLCGTGKQVYCAIFTRKESTGQGKYKRYSEQWALLRDVSQSRSDWLPEGRVCDIFTPALCPCFGLCQVTIRLTSPSIDGSEFKRKFMRVNWCSMSLKEPKSRVKDL